MGIAAKQEAGAPRSGDATVASAARRRHDACENFTKRIGGGGKQEAGAPSLLGDAIVRACCPRAVAAKVQY